MIRSACKVTTEKRKCYNVFFPFLMFPLAEKVYTRYRNSAVSCKSRSKSDEFDLCWHDFYTLSFAAWFLKKKCVLYILNNIVATKEIRFLISLTQKRQDKVCTSKQAKKTLKETSSMGINMEIIKSIKKKVQAALERGKRRKGRRIRKGNVK